MAENFQPPRGGRGSQAKAGAVPSAYWQPPEAVEGSTFWRYQPGGVFLGWSGETPIGVSDDRHLVTVAGARAGKTSTVLLPNLNLYPGSILAIDPKGELARETAAIRADGDRIGHAVHVLDPWSVSGVSDDLLSHFDPLADLRAGVDEAGEADREKLRREWIDDASLITEGLIQDQGENNAHWTESARNVLRGLVLWMLDGACPDGCSLALLPRLLASAGADMREKEEKAGRGEDDADPTLWEALAYYQGNGDDIAAVIRNAGEGMLQTAPKERASILSTARNQLAFLESAPLAESLSRSSFRLADLKRLPMTVYLVLPAARMGTHARWLRLILNLAVAALERERTKPPFPVLFMLEEFAALGHMRALEQASAYMAGFGVKLWVVLQDLTQLKRHYKEGWETFLGNAGVVQAFGNADATTLDYLSQSLGDTSVYIEESQKLNVHRASSGEPGTRENFQRVPLLARHEIAQDFGRSRMRALVIPAGGPPITLTRRHLDHTSYRQLWKDAPS